MLSERARVKPARVLARKDSSTQKNRFELISLNHGTLEPDPKHDGAAMRNERLAPIWREEQGNEMSGLFARGCLEKVKRSDLPMGTRIISSRFHYKIKRHSAGEHLEALLKHGAQVRKEKQENAKNEKKENATKRAKQSDTVQALCLTTASKRVKIAAQGARKPPGCPLGAAQIPGVLDRMIRQNDISLYICRGFHFISS